MIVGPLVVNTLSDADDGACNATNCSLREAINAANGQPGAKIIQFQNGLTGTIRLQSALPAITDDLTITGPGTAALTISGDSDNDTVPDVRIFTLAADVNITGLSLVRGAGNDSNGGGAILGG